MAPDVMRFRRQQTGSWSNPELHVDHDFSTGLRFDDLLDQFLAERRLLRQNVSTVKSDAGEHHIPWPHHTLSDPALEAAWVQYHTEHASLRILPAQENVKGNAGFRVKTRQMTPIV